MLGIQSKALDVGLLVLRMGTGLSLSFVHGWAKLVDAFRFIFAGHDWGFIGLVHGLEFPAPAFFAVSAALGESVSAALVACGFCTRLASGSVVATMAVAVYCNLKMGTPLESACLYVNPFFTPGLTGPGKFSLDYLLRRTRPPSSLVPHKSC